MSPKSRIFVLIALLVAITSPAYGGDIHYKARTWQEGENATEAANMEFDSYISDANAAIYFSASGNPMIPKGTRLVTTDGAKTIYLVDDEKKTYWLMDVQALVNLAADITKATGPMLKIKVENAKIETLETEPGGKIANLDTTYYKTRISYDMSLKVIGLGKRKHIELVREIWVANEEMPEAVGLWIQQDPPDFGDTGMGELIQLELENQRGGLPVKMIEEQVTTNKKGKPTTVRLISQVDLFERVPVDADHFEIGSDYELVASPLAGVMAQTPPSEDQDVAEEKKGKKGRFKRLLKRDGG